MSDTEYEVELMEPADWDAAHLTAWRGGDWTADKTLARITAGGRPQVMVSNTVLWWECPGCGSKYAAMRGDEPVSGWDNPRWLVTFDSPLSGPSATPSLGCPNWRSGTCDGHWWLRSGKLVKA